LFGFITVTPVQLLILIAVIFIVRVVLSLRPVTAGSHGRTAVFAREYLDPFIVAGIAAFLLITFVARTYYIPSASMVPTLQVGDVLLVNKFQYRFTKPNEGDIVVFPPPIPSPDDFIKRVIGRPGDRLQVKNGIVYINGKALDEPYVAQRPDYNLQIRNYGIYVAQAGDLNSYQALDPSAADVPPRKDWTAPDRIPKDCYFMMGDNRNDSEDSHVWGFAQFAGTFQSGPKAGTKASFTGRAFLIFWPFTHLKVL
jgi:signal peptidase I